MELMARNVVVAAQWFNPSILTQIWLVKNGVMAESDFASGCVFSDSGSQVQATDFSFLVVPELLQFSPGSKLDAQREQSLVSDTIGGIVRALPHTPYRGVGLNFIWHEAAEEPAVNDMTRKLFFRSHEPLYAAFDSPTSRFGGYLSKDFQGMRLKLDIKPISVKYGGDEPKPPEHRIQFSFNFHRDLGRGVPIQEIEESLALWGQASLYAESIVRDVLPNG